MPPILNQNTAKQDYIFKESRSYERLQDIALFDRIGKGDEAALAELYQRYKSPIFRYLVNLVLDAGAAEELLQDVFLAAWRRAGAFRGASTVKTWLFSVAHKRAASWLAKKRQDVSLDLLGDIQDESDPPSFQAFLAWQRSEIQAAMKEISPKHRAAIDLFFFHSLSYKEVAQVLDCPVGTVKSRISYGLRSLYLLLSDVR